jgi:hypothetical protein
MDLSLVVSKYIGETENNLARVFEQAEQGLADLRAMADWLPLQRLSRWSRCGCPWTLASL